MENALEYLYPLCDMIAVHDGARPLVRPEDIEKTIAAAKETGGAVLGVKAKDTVKVVREGKVVFTPDRSELFCAQTPQVFKLDAYREAVKRVKEKGLDLTDDAGIFEAAGMAVAAVEGHYDNIKITTPEDLPAAEAMLALQPEWVMEEIDEEGF